MTYLPEIEPARRRVPFISEDPRFLISLFLLTVVVTFVVPRSAGLLLVLVYELVLLVMIGTTPRALLAQARRLSFFVVLILAINAILIDGRPLPLPLSFFSIEGLAAGVYYSLRVLVFWFALAVFLKVAAPEAVAAGLAAFLKRLSPTAAKRVALHGFLAIGFLPLFGDEVARIRAAQSFRGGGFAGGLRQRLTAARLLVVPLLISAIHRSQQLAMAVEVRRIHERIDRVLVLDAPTLRDFAFTGITLIVFLVAVLL
jgi:energy-coupling factor transport system permease protein